MSYYGFGLGIKTKRRKPKKFLGKRTGLFNQQVIDDLKARHEWVDKPPQESNPDSKSTVKGQVAEKRKEMFPGGISNSTFKLLSFIFVTLVVIAFILVLLRLELYV